MIEPRLIPHPHRFEDARGAFTRTFERCEGFRVVEENESFNPKAGTIRGLHWQKPEQTKLVRVLSGAILDVIVSRETLEVRRYEMTPAFGSLIVPKGWAHGFCTLEPNTTVLYKVDEAFAPGQQFGLNPFDPVLAMNWPVARDMAVVSEKDLAAPLLQR